MKIRVLLKLLSVAIFILIMTGCGSSGQTSFNPEEFQKISDLVNSREFIIENEWANPIQGRQINLIDNPNHIIFKGDSVNVHLPYYGIRHTGGGYNREGGIKFKGVAREVKIEENTNRRLIDLSFDGNQNGEVVEFDIRIFASGKTTTTVNSSQRSMISYQGELQAYEKEKN
ncbi:DUF4251 domain-containing protein [Gramella sp. GC03-9]|uniref:DUF4251 domain-containing protein n=1 Tax=Christiangramia oceanisediminis TaxID=2920386 RepID=A0A9X2KY46_9FLAO|nr:DUF4251 domain-containing protein [Gramella oceanisediminis]MCP9200406.1 DUF4251 domain-containing protein [Gramella oceanisediminis]